VDKFVYQYLEEHKDKEIKEQREALEAKIPELMKTLADEGIEVSERLIRLYVRRTFAATKYMPNIDLENDPQLAAAVAEIKKQLNQDSQ